MRGVTIVETIIVLAIAAVSLAVVLTPLQSLVRTRDAADAAWTYGYALRDAAWRARTMESDSAWGVRLASGTVTVFAGSTYAARTTSLDRRYAFPSALPFSGGPTDIIFAKFSGVPGATGTTTFANGIGTSTVSVNAAGLVTIVP